MSNKNEDTSVDTSEYNRNLMNNITRLPLVVSHAQGSQIQTAEHGYLLDFWGDEGVCSLGYNTPEFLQAIDGFLNTRAPHQLPDVYPHDLRWEAAKAICERAGMDRVFFAGSGAEANEAAIKLARKYWWDKEGQPMVGKDHAKIAKRHRIFTLAGNFHGRTANASAAGDYRVSPYHRWGFGPGPTGFGVIDLIDGVFQQVVIDGWELKTEISGDLGDWRVEEPDWSTVAAIILAPVLGNNVVETYPPEFWAALEKVRKDHGVLIVYDDVQAGCGRAGYYATWQHPGCRVKPDIMSLAKGIALGFPMAATLASEEVASAFTPGVHFNTFAGSPFVCYMALELIKHYDEKQEEWRGKGVYIRNTLRAFPWMSYANGWGMLNGFRPNFEAYGYNGYDFIHAARDFGLSLVTHRPLGIIRFTPPLNVSDLDLATAFSALDNTHKKLVARAASVAAGA